jgi:hypothetical protein
MAEGEPRFGLDRLKKALKNKKKKGLKKDIATVRKTQREVSKAAVKGKSPLEQGLRAIRRQAQLKKEAL